MAMARPKLMYPSSRVIPLSWYLIIFNVVFILQKPFKYAFCGPPMHGTVPAAWIRAWLIYHNYIWGGEAHFFFYNVGGLKDKDRALFKDFLDAGILSIEDLRSPDIHSDFPMWYFHQLLYINDCLHRSRPIADFAFFADFDEYLQVSNPYH